jgi:hypothetical protein
MYKGGSVQEEVDTKVLEMIGEEAICWKQEIDRQNDGRETIYGQKHFIYISYKYIVWFGE